MLGLGIYLFFSFNSTIVNIKSDFIKLSQIDRFKLNFFRLLAILRDVASGFYDEKQRNWIPDLLHSYY